MIYPIKKLFFLFLLIPLSGVAQDFPLTDMHVHLKGDLTIHKAIDKSRESGIRYGIAVNCGLGFPTQDDPSALAFLDSMRQYGFLLGMQAEGREWTHLFSPSTIARFDYVFTDAMTFTDDKGKRSRLWIREEVDVPDTAQFMEMLVNRIEGIMNSEPIDIYVNPTFLPDCIAMDYERLWTRDRMLRVINAAKKNGIAIEINDRYRIPSKAFIQLAVSHGILFTCGTNNVDSHFGQLDYCRQMIRECDLRRENFFIPRPDGQKPIQQARFKSK